VGLCIPAVILGIGSPSGLERFAAAAMVAMTVGAVALGCRGGGLTRRDGAVIIVVYAAFVVVVCVL
jgi:hypothetical protein